MPRIDPLKLLTCLKVLLAPNGGIRSANEVKRLAELMAKYSKKLVSKCIYIQILKSTDTELLGKFMGVGGWSLTHMWLTDGIKAANWSLVQEILELLLLCPVDVQRLRSNSAPKLVKGLCKDGGNEGVRILATKLVEQWLKVVKGETMAVTEQQAQTAQQVPTTATVNGVISNTTVTIPKSTTDTVHQTTMDDVQTGLVSPTKSNADESLVYKFKVTKDGKSVLAKVANNDTTGSSVVDGESTKVKDADSISEITTAKTSNDGDDKLSDKENETKTNESLDKELSKEKDSDKEKSRSSTSSSSSKDKDRHRSSSSSSSSRHKSSSSKSSSSSSTKSGSSSSSRSKSSSSSHNSSSSSSSKHKDKESSSDRDKHRSSSSGKSSSSSSSSRDKDKSRSKDKEREKSRSSSDKDKDKSRSDKDKDRSDKESDRDSEDLRMSPSIDKLGRIPKLSSEEPEEPTVTSITIPSKKASMSIEIRRGDVNRPKTVKTFKSQFRSHGLYEEAPPPPSRKGLRKPASTAPTPGIAIPSNIGHKRSSPPPMAVSACTPASAKELLPPAEKKLKIDLTTAPATEKPGAVKFIAPKPKPSTLVESDMFMDALSAAAPKKDVRKRKRRPSSSKEPTTPEEPESPGAAGANVAPLKFYQDTLEESEKTENNSSDDIKDDSACDDQKNEDEDDIPLKKVKEQIEEKVREKEMEERLARENEEPELNPVKKPPGPGCGPDGPPGVLMLHRRKGPKKKLTWRTQEQLEEVRFFEVDVNERVNVTKTFTDMKQMERFNEREAFTLARKLNTEDIMVEQTPWVALIEIDDVPPHPEGSQSKEKKIQMERELTTLKALYFNRHMIPDSASEPDMEQYQITEPAVIPLDDITGNPDAVNDFTSMPWPDPKGSPPQNDDFMNGGDMGFPGGQFNPFMPFSGNGGGWMGPGMNNGPPNGMMGPPMGGPMGNFNPMMGGPPSNMMMNGGPPNLMGGMGGPDDMGGMGCNMNMMNPGFDPGFDPSFDPGFGPGGPGGPNFGGPPNGGMGGGFNNFGPPMGMNPNGMNMNNGQRGGGGGNRGGSWRSGSAGPPGGNDGPGGGGGGGGNWRGGGGRGVGGGNNQRRGGGGRDNGRNICKQFQRGYCRNGNKCNFFHPPGGNNQRF